jgi:hypothetical protein
VAGGNGQARLRQALRHLERLLAQYTEENPKNNLRASLDDARAIS